jgi:disulfide bond formation protein DsbB
MTRSLAITLNALGLYAIALVLLVAFGAQLILQELPCPLCLLQRIQFAMLAVGPILNIRFGPRPSHYAVSLLTAAAGAAFASRQVLLHIMPGDAGYGSALLGYHYYTWAFIGFVVGAHRPQRDFDLAGMRLRRLPGQPGDIRIAQTRIVSRARSSTPISAYSSIRSAIDQPRKQS